MISIKFVHFYIPDKYKICDSLYTYKICHHIPWQVQNLSFPLQKIFLLKWLKTEKTTWFGEIRKKIFFRHYRFC